MESTPHKIKLELEDELNGVGSSRLRNVYAHKAERSRFDEGWKSKLDEVREYLRNMAEDEYDEKKERLLSLAKHGLIVSNKEEAKNVITYAHEKGDLSEREIGVLEGILGEKILPEAKPDLEAHTEQEGGDEESGEDVVENATSVGEEETGDSQVGSHKEEDGVEEVSLFDYLKSIRDTKTNGDLRRIDALISNIRNSNSTEEVMAYLDQAHRGQWELPDDNESAESILTSETVVSTGPNGKKYIGGLIDDSDYGRLVSILKKGKVSSEAKIENDSSWVPKLRSIVKRVKDLSDSVIGRKNKAELVLELSGADRKEAAMALRGHLPEEELHKFKDLIGHLQEEKDVGATAIPIKKEVTVSVEDLMDDMENDKDGVNAVKAKNLFSNGSIEESLSVVEKIQDEEVLANIVRDIVIDCVNDQDFQNAIRFISKIKDEKYRAELGEWLQSQVKVPKINIRRDTGELKYNKDKDQSFEKEEEKDKEVEPKEEEEPREVDPEVDEKFDLPLKPEAETVEPVADLELNNPETEPAVEAPATVESVEGFDVEKARDEYAKQYIEYKNKIRSKRGWFAKHLADLGFDKQLPESEKPDELKDAERAYIEAKKKKNESLFSATVKRKKSVSGQIFDLREVEYDFNPAILEEAEREFLALQEKIQESIPPLEKGMAGKALEKWMKLGRPARIVLSTTFLTTGNLAFGALTLPLAGTYAGMRLARAVKGTVVAQGAGLGVEKYFKNKNEKDREGIEEEYSMELNESNFAEREKEIMQKLESEIDKKKRQRLVKAGVMAGVGGLATYNMGSLDHIMTSNAGLHTDIPDVPDHPIDIKDMVKDLPQKDLPDAVHPVEVPVSSKGFIDTIHNLKEGVIKQYGNIDNVPDELKRNILDHSDVELAKSLHMYDPGNNLSGVGYKGETIGLDSSGNVVYHHLDGRSDVLLDTKTGLAQHFNGPMSGVGSLAEAGNTQLVPPIDFEGGKIYVLKDVTSPNTVNVLLDGKEIGKGVVDNGIPKLKIDSSLKGSWFQADNVYERALKVAKSAVKNKK